MPDRSTITKPSSYIEYSSDSAIGTDGDDRRLMRQMDSDGEYFVGHWMNQETF